MGGPNPQSLSLLLIPDRCTGTAASTGASRSASWRSSPRCSSCRRCCSSGSVSQSGRTLPGQSPARLGMTVALDLANVLERDPQTDLAPYVRDQYAQYTHPFFVMLADGTVITSGSQTFAEPLLRRWRARAAALERAAARTRGERPDGPRSSGRRSTRSPTIRRAGRGGLRTRSGRRRRPFRAPVADRRRRPPRRRRRRAAAGAVRIPARPLRADARRWSPPAC